MCIHQIHANRSKKKKKELVETDHLPKEHSGWCTPLVAGKGCSHFTPSRGEDAPWSPNHGELPYKPVSIQWIAAVPPTQPPTYRSHDAFRGCRHHQLGRMPWIQLKGRVKFTGWHRRGCCHLAYKQTGELTGLQTVSSETKCCSWFRSVFTYLPKTRVICPSCINQEVKRKIGTGKAATVNQVIEWRNPGGAWSPSARQKHCIWSLSLESYDPRSPRWVIARIYTLPSVL